MKYLTLFRNSHIVEDLAHLEDLYHSLSWDGDIVIGESLKQHLIGKKKEPLLKKESDEVHEVWKSSADARIIYRLTGASIDGKRRDKQE